MVALPALCAPGSVCVQAAHYRTGVVLNEETVWFDSSTACLLDLDYFNFTVHNTETTVGRLTTVTFSLFSIDSFQCSELWDSLSVSLERGFFLDDL